MSRIWHPTTPLSIGLELVQIIHNFGVRNFEANVENGVRTVNIAISAALIQNAINNTKTFHE